MTSEPAVPASPVTAQPDAADQMLTMLHEIDDAAAPVTGPDVAQQLANKVWDEIHAGKESDDIAALIRTALEEQTRQLRQVAEHLSDRAQHQRRSLEHAVEDKGEKLEPCWKCVARRVLAGGKPVAKYVGKEQE